MNVFFVDLSMRNEEHVFFNSAFVRICHSIFENARFLFYGDKQHCSNVKTELNDLCDISFVDIKVLYHQTWRILFADLYSCGQIFCIMKKAKRVSGVMIVLNRLPICLIWLNFLNLFFRINVITILHGELESLVNWKNVRGLTKYYYLLFKMAYCLSSSRLSYVALGETIRRNISNLNFGKARILTIDHPYDYSISFPIQSLIASPMRLGIIGKAMVRKNSGIIFDLAQEVAKKERTLDVCFCIAGVVEEALKKKANQYVSYCDFSDRLSKDEYFNLIKVLHYSLLFYSKDINVALASGSFFDCIKFEKPILALRGNQFVDYYMEKYEGIGYLFETVDDMLSFILNPNGLRMKFLTEYQYQIEQMRKAKINLAIPSISANLKKQLYDTV